jgi:hypothetical protein
MSEQMPVLLLKDTKASTKSAPLRKHPVRRMLPTRSVYEIEPVRGAFGETRIVRTKLGAQVGALVFAPAPRAVGNFVLTPIFTQPNDTTH